MILADVYPSRCVLCCAGSGLIVLQIHRTSARTLPFSYLEVMDNSQWKPGSISVLLGGCWRGGGVLPSIGVRKRRATTDLEFFFSSHVNILFYENKINHQMFWIAF